MLLTWFTFKDKSDNIGMIPVQFVLNKFNAAKMHRFESVFYNTHSHTTQCNTYSMAIHTMLTHIYSHNLNINGLFGHIIVYVYHIFQCARPTV